MFIATVLHQRSGLAARRGQLGVGVGPAGGGDARPDLLTTDFDLPLPHPPGGAPAATVTVIAAGAGCGE